MAHGNGNRAFSFVQVLMIQLNINTMPRRRDTDNDSIGETKHNLLLLCNLKRIIPTLHNEKGQIDKGYAELLFVAKCTTM